MGNGKSWTIEETELLKANYGKVKTNDLAKRLSRTPRALRAKAHWAKIQIKFKEKMPIVNLNSIQLAYLAGLIDGEGCLTITARQNIGLNPMLHIGMIDKNTIDTVFNWLKASGVNCYRWTARRRRNHPLHAIVVRKVVQLLPLLEALRPYLITKLKQALLLIDFCKLRVERAYKHFNSQEKEIKQKIQRLNQLRLETLLVD